MKEGLRFHSSSTDVSSAMFNAADGPGRASATGNGAPERSNCETIATFGERRPRWKMKRAARVTNDTGMLNANGSPCIYPGGQ